MADLPSLASALHAASRFADHVGDGTLDMCELYAALETSFPDFSAQELTNIVEQAMVNEQGKVDYVEFVQDFIEGLAVHDFSD